MPTLDLRRRLPESALAFRGYNVKNLGRTAEFLKHRAYGPIFTRHLQQVSAVAADLLHRRVNLLGDVQESREHGIEGYGEALALILAVEAAQLESLAELFDVDYRGARFSYGFSLGEVAAVSAGGVLDTAAALSIILPLTEDCVALAENVTLGVLFTRSRELKLDDVRRLCLEINQEGRGVMGISAYLAPNSLLLLGQLDTLDRLMARASDALNVHVHLRKNDQRWPPLHTPIVWQRQIPNRAAQCMHTAPFAHVPPKPAVFSLVTGTYGYSPVNAREMLYHWVDHSQRLWDAVYETLASGVTSVIHIGPAPNIIPATFKRLSADVISQASESRSVWALSAAVRRQWLRRLLPQRAALLRAPDIENIVLEDWLLANEPK